MEDTNIPDQLTYHDPVQRNPKEEKDPWITAARILSAVFTPFMVPFVAFVLLFLFTYLRILPLQYKLIVLAIVYCFTILLPMLSIYLMQKINGWSLHELGKRERRYVPYILTILSYVGCLITMYRYHLPRYMGGIIVATLLCMVICALINLKMENQHPHGKRRHDDRRIAFIQFYIPVQSYVVALHLHPAHRHARIGTHHRPPAHLE